MDKKEGMYFEEVSKQFGIFYMNWNLSYESNVCNLCKICGNFVLNQKWLLNFLKVQNVCYGCYMSTDIVKIKFLVSFKHLLKHVPVFDVSNASLKLYFLWDVKSCDYCHFFVCCMSDFDSYSLFTLSWSTQNFLNVGINKDDFFLVNTFSMGKFGSFWCFYNSYNVFDMKSMSCFEKNYAYNKYIPWKSELVCSSYLYYYYKKYYVFFVDLFGFYNETALVKRALYKVILLSKSNFYIVPIFSVR